MTSATKARPKTGPLSELQAREKAWADRKAEADRLGSEHGQKARLFEALHDQRRRLVHSEPGLVDHTGAADTSVKGNPIVALDEEIAGLGDLLDLHGRMLHARRLEESAKQAAHDYTAAHLDEIVRALEPEAEAVRAEVVRVMGELATASAAYLGLAQRVNALKGTVPDRRGQRVPAIDTGSDLLKLSQNYEPPPLPTEIR